MNRAALLAEVSRRLGNRQLVWFGTRGDDVESLAGLPQLTAAYSVISAYQRRSTIEGLALEDLTGMRVDLDVHDIDEEEDQGAIEHLRQSMLRTLATPSCVFTYRPSTLVSSVCFARRDRTQYLGMFKDHQFAFEHKPWVESAVSDLGIPAIPWAYVADDDQRETLAFLKQGPVMLRKSRSSGGTGLFLVEHPAHLESAWPHGQEAFVSVAPYVTGGMPVNVGATVWPDGVTVGLPSVQLIGIAGCTELPFGYCGNDFGAVRELPIVVVDSIESSTKRIGEWLRSRGYVGTFGVDYLVKDDVPLFLEVNPRFQGSTHLSARLAVEAGESCLLLEHLAANLGVEKPDDRGLAERVAEVRDAAHFVVHRPVGARDRIDPSELVASASTMPAFQSVDVLTRPGLRTGKGATIARLTVASRLTSSGYAMAHPWSALAQGWSDKLTTIEASTGPRPLDL